ncbi:MAG TPA: gamma-glutamyl-gamma-aminobutyrate hydrolase family protein [Candidatus Limnocylindrales bacterium]
MAPSSRTPRIVVTLMVAAAQAEPDIAERKNQLYVDAVVRQGATAIRLDATAPAVEREAAFATMDGLLMTGGADLDPARYGRPNQGSRDVEPDRDELEAAAWTAAVARGIPVLGICRGLQAMNAFAGGTLLQDVAGHVGNGWGHGPATTHSMHLVPGTATASILDPAASGADLVVNSYHHQAVRAAELAPAFTATAFADSAAGPLVEAFESTSGPWRMAVQCHPERTESTPAVFEGLFAAFVEACRASRQSNPKRGG